MNHKYSTRNLFNGFRWLWIIGLTLLVGAGCAGWSSEAKPTTGRDPSLAEVPNKDETVRGEDDPPVVTLEIGSALHEKKLLQTEDLPGNIVIPTTNLTAVPVTSALQAVLTGTDVSLSWDSGSFDDHLVTVMNLSGPLPQVVEKICAAGRVFCSYRHGSLELRDKETFIVPLPPIAKASSVNNAISSGNSNYSGSNSSTSINSNVPTAASVASVATAAGNSMADAITELAGEKAKVDDQGGNIIYTTDVTGEERVREYIEQLRNGRPLIVLQLYIWEVELNKENTEGINWNSLKAGKIGGHTQDLVLSAPASQFPSVSGGATFGAVTAGRISADLIAAFLSTQGRTQTISNPQITFVSGSSAQFVVGGQTNYISSIGQLVTASNVSGNNNSGETSGVGTNTVSTSSLSTGLSIGVSGAYENGVVFANFNLNVTNLQSLNPTNTGGQTIDLPTTTNRQVSTIIRVRPGDNLVMAGMVSSQDTNARQGIPLPGDARIPMYGNDQYRNTELVIMVKPSVVLFSDKVAREEAKRQMEARPLPAATMIDKDGAKTLAIPGRESSAEPVKATPSLAQAEPAAAAEAADNKGNGSAPAGYDFASEDGAPVDRRLMQRGFSHAFDSLLQTPQIPPAEGNKP